MKRIWTGSLILIVLVLLLLLLPMAAQADPPVDGCLGSDNHDWALLNYKDATCTESGYKEWICQICMEIYEETIPAHGHNYVETLGNVTCQGGSIFHECTYCHDSYEEIVPAPGHSWDDGVVITEATCTTEGAMFYSCKLCPETKTEAIPALGHDYRLTNEMLPGCETNGARSYTCSRCGDEYVESVPELGHTWVEESVIQPTCTEAGSRVLTCYNDVIFGPHSKTETIPALGHSPQTVAGKAATCTEAGLTDGSTCSRCGEVLTAQQTIPALGHSSQTVAGKAATCTEAGLTDGSTCSRCGEVLTAQQTIAALGHSPQTVAGKAATCTEAGLTEGSTCSRCGAVLTAQQTIPALGHSPVAVGGFAATCTEAGLTEGSTCSRCGAVLTEQTYTPALGHDYEATEYKEATATEDGYIKYVCSRCWDSYTEIISKTPHEHVYAVSAETPATCTNAGSRTYSCSICGNSYSESIPALGHAPQAVPGRAATCTEPGLTEGSVCSRCGTVLSAQAAIPATGHNWGDWITMQAATAAADGWMQRTCRNNPSHTEQAVIPATGGTAATGTLIVTKIAGDTNQPLAGAHLQLEGPDLVDQWVSTLEPHTVTGLTINEQYTLVETEAPEGYKKAESISFRVTDANPISMTMVDEKDEEDTEKHASLTLTWMYDCNEDLKPYPSDQDTFDGEDTVLALGTWVNNGNVPLSVFAFAKAEGVYNYTSWYMGDFNPGESDYNGWGRMPIRDSINPGTETEELLGTVTISWYVVGYDPDTYLDKKFLDRNIPGPELELCRSETITRTWKVRKPGASPEPDSGRSQLAVSLAQGGSFNKQADPSGYQMGEDWDTTITVQNIGPVDVDDITLRVDFIAVEEYVSFIQCLTFGFPTDLSSWYEVPVDDLYGHGIAAGKEMDLWAWSPNGKFTAEDVARGYVYAIASVRWTDPDSGKEKTASSAPLYLPVISKTGLLLKKGIDHGPANDSYFQEGEAIPWTLTVSNNSKETITNVTVTDQGVVVGTFAEIQPGETLPCSVPPHTVTEYEAKVVGTVTNMASAAGADLQGAVQTWTSNPCSVPTNPFSPTPLPKPDDKEKNTDGGDGKEDPLPPGTPETPSTPGIPGGGLDPLGEAYGVTVGATVYKTTAHGPKNGEWYDIGETVDYTITVKNIGEEVLENLQLYDSLGGLAPVGTIQSLAPGGEYTFPFRWTINDANIKDGYAVNSATLTYTFLGVNGTPRNSNPVYVIAGENGHLPIDGILIGEKGETPEIPHFPGLTGSSDGGDPFLTPVTGPDGSPVLGPDGMPVLAPAGTTVVLDENGNPVLSPFGTPVLKLPDGTYFTLTPDGKAILTDQEGNPVLDQDGNYIYVDLSGLNACALELEALGDTEIRYTLHACMDHKAAAEAAEAALQAGNAAEACRIWKEETEKLYETLYEAGDAEGKAAVLQDKAAFEAFADSTANLAGDEAAAELLRIRCARLCCMLHTAPERLADSLAGDNINPSAGGSHAKTVRRIGALLGYDSVMTEEYAPNEAETLDSVLELLRGRPVWDAGNVFGRGQLLWQMKLDDLVVEEYREADSETRKKIACWRIGLDTLSETEQPLYELIYSGYEAVPAELLMNLYKDPVFDIMRLSGAKENTRLNELIARCYRFALGREGSDGEIAYWAALNIDQGRTPADIIGDILHSEEFVRRGFGNEETVTVLYRICFSREPDAGGLGFWTRLLDSGEPVETIISGLIDSDEFKALMGE